MYTHTHVTHTHFHTHIQTHTHTLSHTHMEEEDYVLMPGVTVVLHRNIYLNIDYISIDMHMDEDVLGP